MLRSGPSLIEFIRAEGPVAGKRMGSLADWTHFSEAGPVHASGSLNRRTRKFGNCGRPVKIAEKFRNGCLNSLFLRNNSLILKIFSLLICVGNCSRSGCSAAVSWHVIVSLSPRIAKFPVKFPVSREFAWRRVRSALRRQPGSLTSALGKRAWRH